jgi:hypothetical protein
MAAGVADPDYSAERLADQEKPRDVQVVSERFEVPQVGAQAVVQGGGPFAVAVAAQIQGIAAVFLPQRQADDVPGMRAEPAAVQEHQRPPAGVPGRRPAGPQSR